MTTAQIIASVSYFVMGLLTCGWFYDVWFYDEEVEQWLRLLYVLLWPVVIVARLVRFLTRKLDLLFDRVAPWRED